MRSLRTTIAAGAATALLGTATFLAGAVPAAAAPVTSTATLSTGTLAVTYSDTTISPGDPVAATVTFTNTSANTATYSYATTGLPTVFDIGECAFEPGQTVTCSQPLGLNAYSVTVDNLAPGTSTTVDLDLTTKADLAPGTTSVPQLFRDPGSSTRDFTPPLTFTVEPPAPDEADISVDLSASSGLLSSQINYTLSVNNDGPADATGVQVVVDLPTQTSSVSGLPTACTYSSASDEVTCDYALIAAGGSRAPSFTATVGLLSIGQLPASATRVASSPNDPNPANDTNTANCTVLTSLIITCS